MAKNETKFLTPAKLKKDSTILAAISGLTDYKPINPDYSITQLRAAEDELVAAQKAFARIEASFETARDALVAKQWTRHNLLLGAKQQVIAQYGDDSDEKQAVGLTKKSHRSRPQRKGRKVVNLN